MRRDNMYFSSNTDVDPLQPKTTRDQAMVKHSQVYWLICNKGDSNPVELWGRGPQQRVVRGAPFRIWACVM